MVLVFLGTHWYSLPFPRNPTKPGSLLVDRLLIPLPLLKQQGIRVNNQSVLSFNATFGYFFRKNENQWRTGLKGTGILHGIPELIATLNY